MEYGLLRAASCVISNQQQWALLQWRSGQVGGADQRVGHFPWANEVH